MTIPLLHAGTNATLVYADGVLSFVPGGTMPTDARASVLAYLTTPRLTRTSVAGSAEDGTLATMLAPSASKAALLSGLSQLAGEVGVSVDWAGIIPPIG